MKIGCQWSTSHICLYVLCIQNRFILINDIWYNKKTYRTIPTNDEHEQSLNGITPALKRTWFCTEASLETKQGNGMILNLQNAIGSRNLIMFYTNMFISADEIWYQMTYLITRNSLFKLVGKPCWQHDSVVRQIQVVVVVVVEATRWQ
jgi:hypothetical protein